MKWKRWMSGMLGILFVAAGCSQGDNDSSSDSEMPNLALNNSQIVDGRLSVNLRTFDSNVLAGYAQCTDLAVDLEEAGKLLANLTIANQKRQGLDDVIILTTSANDAIDGIAEPAALDEGGGEVTSDLSSTAETTTESTAAGDSSEFETNNQVSGVDEGDIVKSDGQFIYVAYGTELIVHDLSGTVLDRETLPDLPESLTNTESESETSDSDASSGETSSVTADDSTVIGTPDVISLPIVEVNQENIQALLFDNGRVVVLTSGYNFGSDSAVSQFMRVLLYDVAADGQMTFVASQDLKGGFQAAREVDGRAYVVTLANLNHHELVNELWRFNSEYEGMSDDEYEQAALQKALTTIPTWRDSVMQALFADASGNVAADACQHIVQISSMQTASNDDNSLDLTGGQGVLNAFAQVLTFDISDGVSTLNQSGAFVPSSYFTTYATNDMLILGGSGWNQFSFDQWQDATFLMAFSLQNDQANPIAVGQVDGQILNQFSMDFHNDHLRVASNIFSQWGLVDNTWQEVSSSESLVTVLQINNNQFEKVGEVRGLGQGEHLFAARFLEDRGFVVTFRNIDPFFTLDLSDPTNPQVLGELKVPGFSNQLHPIGENHILAIGQDADEEEGFARGLQVALFDVTDLANPVQSFKHVVEGWSSSGAQHDHRAFRYLESREKLILPLSNSTTEGFFDGFQIYNVSTTDGISVAGQIEHQESSSSQNSFCYSSAYLSPRSLVFGDQLVTLKGHSVASHDFDSLTNQWTLQLDDGQNHETCYPWFLEESAGLEAF